MISMLGSLVMAGLSACSDGEESTIVQDDGVKMRRITITQTEDAAAARNELTRASLVESDGLTASWTTGDGLTYCNLSRTNPIDDEIYSGSLTAVTTAATSQFTGDVTCRAGDHLAVVYPAATFSTNEQYTVSLTGQDGTLGTIASTYHYVYGMATVTAVTDKTADAAMEKMKSLLTVCKFSFIDRASSSSIPITSLAISYGGTGSDAGKYPQSATIDIKDKDQAGVHAAAAAVTEPLIISATGQTEVYVALLPTGGQRTFNFTVTNGSGTFSGTAKATLQEGEYVVATGLKLTKQ